MSSPGRYDVIWPGIALADLRQLITYISIDNPMRAKELLSHIKSRASALHLFPRRGRIIPELHLLGLDVYRELIIEPFRLLFRIEGKKVFVFGIFDGRRDLQEILFERLIHLSDENI